MRVCRDLGFKEETAGGEGVQCGLMFELSGPAGEGPLERRPQGGERLLTGRCYSTVNSITKVRFPVGRPVQVALFLSSTAAGPVAIG